MARGSVEARNTAGTAFDAILFLEHHPNASSPFPLSILTLPTVLDNLKILLAYFTTHFVPFCAPNKCPEGRYSFMYV